MTGKRLAPTVRRRARTVLRTTYRNRYQADEPAPCDGCEFTSHCRRYKFACDAFGLFVSGLGAKHWMRALRKPTRAGYDALKFDRLPSAGRFNFSSSAT